MTDQQANLAIIARTWGGIQKDPELLEGLSVGEFDTFVAAVIHEIVSQSEFNRCIPLRLWIRMTKNSTDFEVLLECIVELLRIPAIRAHLDGMEA